MSHTFGIFSNGQDDVIFRQLKAQLVNGSSDPNHPDAPGSPNSPRSNSPYLGPILGDDGNGKIGRWQHIKLNALEVIIDQMLEQYLRDRTWYAGVRCREALWNMYRRLEWWVLQQTNPQRGDYLRALQMIKDCINETLKSAEDEAGEHMGIALPHCPAPLPYSYTGDYFNHFNAQTDDTEMKLFSLKDLPKQGRFPGFFRYVSSSEDQEWELVHSTGVNEQVGTENIMKLSTDVLNIGNSSKITFNWRFKKSGFIQFKYLASATAGNGLLFFINNEQVGGEWNSETDWKEIRFNVSQGQTYKFDWLVRKQSNQPFGKNAIYIKDVECFEIVRTWEAPTPPDFDTLGRGAFDYDEYEWITYSSQSIIRTEFDGIVTDGEDGNSTRTFLLPTVVDCDGEVSFSYRTGIKTPAVEEEWNMIFQDAFTQRTQRGDGPHGSYVLSDHGGLWIPDGTRSTTQADNAEVTYEVTVGDGSTTVDIFGAVSMECPVQQIDHYVDTVMKTMSTAGWVSNGINPLIYTGGVLVGGNATEGYGSANTEVILEHDGWFTFSYNHSLRSMEQFLVKVNGVIVFQSTGAKALNNVKIPLRSGINRIEFGLNALATEQYVFHDRTFNLPYVRNTAGQSMLLQGAFGSSVNVTRNWDVQDGGAYAYGNGQTITYNINLKPWATFYVHEYFKIIGSSSIASTPTFEENFNVPGGMHDARVVLSPNWEWQDIITRYNPNGGGDGVFKVEGKTGSVNTIALNNMTTQFGGLLRFEYGGAFSQYETLDLYADSMLIWSGANNTTSAVGTQVEIQIPAGTSQIRWEYKNLGGNTIPIPPSGSGTIPDDGAGTSDPYGEVCYPQGSMTYPINYLGMSGGQGTPRTGSIGWNGNSAPYMTPTTHATGLDGATMVRDFYTPSFGSVTYSENLKVMAGNQIPTTSKVDIVVPQRIDSRGNPIVEYLELRNIVPGQSTSTFEIGDFSTVGDTVISFDYLSFLDNPTGQSNVKKNLNGRDARYRGELTAWLLPIGVGPIDNDDYIIFQEYKNVGTPSQKWALNWGESKNVRIVRNMAAGRYRLVFGLKDTVNDSDRNSQGVPYFFAYQNVKFGVTQNNNPSTWDSTTVRVELIDKSTGLVVRTQSHSANATGNLDIPVVFNNLVPGSAYQVKYTLIKGAGLGGGAFGTGGSMGLSGGKFMESWANYCIDSNGHAYRQGSSPNPTLPVNPSTGNTFVPANPSAWCWIDAIRYYHSTGSVCSDSGITATLTENGAVIETIIEDPAHGVSPAGFLTGFTRTNQSNETKNYTVTFTFKTTCGDTGYAHGALVNINDALQPSTSQVRVTDFQAVDQEAIWMGGCYTSNIKVTIFDEGDNVVMPTETFNAETIGNFSVINLANSPYSKYRVVIETDQQGEVSTVTGRSYLTRFNILSMQAFERFVVTPDAYNGKLEFFIGDELIDTYTEEGGFFTVTYPISKGSHELKWVFSELSTEDSYDFCDIDFVKITNWICDSITVVPYCDVGDGDKCVEALIRCLIDVWKNRPQACVIGRKIWLFT